MLLYYPPFSPCRLAIFGKRVTRSDLEKIKDDYELFDTVTNFLDEEIAEKYFAEDSLDREGLFDFIFGKSADNYTNAMKVAEETLAISPSQIKGISRTKVMSFKDADKGNANKHYNIAGGRTNCQSSVVAFEARLRGYDVTAKTSNYWTERVAAETRKAWRTQDGKKPRYIYASNVTDAKSCLDWLEKRIKENERYTLEFDWKNGNGGHIISAFRDDKKNLVLYDPQCDIIMTKRRDILDLLTDIEHGKTSTYKGSSVSTKILRIDNLMFNETYFDKILEKT